MNEKKEKNKFIRFSLLLLLISTIITISLLFIDTTFIIKVILLLYLFLYNLEYF